MEIKKVGVVGCGQMGSGITQVVAQSGYQTTVMEVGKEFLDKGLKSIKTNLDRNAEKGKMTREEADAAFGRIKGTLKVEDFNDCDLVIEAAIENLAEKKKVFASLDKVCPPHAIIASNTSSMSLTEMAMATKRQQLVIGMHFFNPVPVMKLLELVTTNLVSDDTCNTVRKFGGSLGKTVIVAKDQPGFIVNRLLEPYLLEAIRLYESGAATKEDIDTGMALGCNHPMGPLALCDLVGLDTVYYVGESMYSEFRDPKFAPPVLLKRMVTAGHLGRKTGKGFYDYK